MEAYKSLSEQVKTLILKGDLEEAAEEIISFFDKEVLENKDKDVFQLYNQTIHQVSQLNELRNAKMSGIIDRDDAELKRNQIRQALLNINNNLARVGKQKRVLIQDPLPKSTVTQRKGPPPYLFILAAIIIVGGILVWNTFSSTPDTGRTTTTPQEVLPRDNDQSPEPSPEETQPPEREEPPAPIEPTTQTLTLVPDIEDMGRAGGGGLSGSLRSDHGQAFSPPSFGDDGYGKGRRGFLTFILEDIPSGSKIVNANLYCQRGGQSGDPFVFENILIEQVKIGSSLDGSDYNKNGTLVKRVKIRDLTPNTPIDITDAVRLAHRNNIKNFTLRFRSSWGNNNDEVSDVWAFSYSRGNTRLEVEFE